MKLILETLLFCTLCISIRSYKILGVCPAPVHSHFTLSFQLMKELADRGHEVTFINSHPQKNPIKNFKDVSVENVEQIISDKIEALVSLEKMPFLQQLEFATDYGTTYSKATLLNENVQKLLNSNEKFDLVILHQFLDESLAYFAHRFNCPLIILAPSSTNVFHDHIFGNPAAPSYVSHFAADYGTDMNFWQRLENTMMKLTAELYIHNRMIPSHNQILKEVIPDSPDLSTILYNASLMLTASHVALGDPKPLQGNIKEIGGFHVKSPKPLPKDLQEFMDNSPEGVVIFSMGSNLKSASFEPEKKKAILNGLSKIKQKVLWKFEADLPEKPENVKIMKWLPQVDVLAHPNTVAFISHGGLLGTTEAVYYGVPILGLPVFWDQFKNIGGAVRKGIAVNVDFHNLDEESFTNSLKEILSDPKYRKNAKEVSEILRDQPMKQMDEAVFWIEYVIRHKGAGFLRSGAVDLRWYQLYLLDIIVFFTALVIVVFIILYIVLSLVCKRKRGAGKEKNN